MALTDIDQAGLAETAASLDDAEGCTQHLLDVADPSAVADFPQQVLACHPGVDLLVNNAGVALGGSFEQIAQEDFEWLFGINFWGVVRMTRAFLPALRASSEGRLVNLSSIFGVIAPPGHTAYVASKFAVRGFSESLRHELRGSGVGVTVVHPGGVKTAIARNARAPRDAEGRRLVQARATFESRLRLAPHVAGEAIVRGVERRKPRVLVGSDAKAAALIERLAPVSYWRVIGRAGSW